MAYYHDQHLAWQQRVGKELNAASRFLTQYSTFNRPQSTTSSNSAHSKHSNMPYLARNDLRHLNVYAEVRGKYARPPPPAHTKHDLLEPKENPVISRPSTSGALRPRSQSCKKSDSGMLSQKQAEKPQNERKKHYRKSYRSVTSETAPKQVKVERVSFEPEQNPVISKVETKNEDLKSLNEDEYDINEEADNVEDLQEDPESFRDKGSQVTTSSQRRYILELEALLREEKMKRYKLEEKMKKIVEDKK